MATEALRPPANLADAAPRDPRSFAARSVARQDLFIDTASSQGGPAEPTLSPTSPSEYYGQYNAAAERPRQGSVPDRSPLQTLELKLGDISKEEKRARAEEAEELARRTSTRRGRPGDWTGGQVAEPAAASHAPVPEQPPIIRAARNGNGNGNIGTRDRAPEQPISLSKRQSESYPQPARTQSVKTPGYDVRRSFLPAAAAVGAYETYRRRSSGLYSPVDGNDDSEGSDVATRDIQAPQIPAKPAPRARPTVRIETPTSSVPKAPAATPRVVSVTSPTSGKADKSRNPASNDAPAPKSALKPSTESKHASLHSDRVGSSKASASTAKALSPDPLPPSAVRAPKDAGANYMVSPQTAAGQDARKQVAFGDADPNENTAAAAQDSNKGYLESFLHRNPEEPLRKYITSKNLAEWKSAETAQLVADDLNLDQASDNAWWERNQKTKGGVKPSVAFADGRGSRFEPPLKLRCGPLLRYTGIRTEQTAARKFWRGSVMIVTDDASSSKAPPVLTLFKQPIELASRPTPPDPAMGESHSVANDLIAGMKKVGRAGETLYVKPIYLIPGGVDLSQTETSEGLFERETSNTYSHGEASRLVKYDGEKAGRIRQVPGHRLHAERGVTFWRFNLEVELTAEQSRVAYRINSGPASAFWVPGKDQSMSIMFHSCNGFSLTVDTDEFSGPDPMWRDVLSSHQIRPFHCMIGGGDQIYNDRAMRDTTHFQEWLGIKNAHHKHGAPFSKEMQDELEQFYLDRYAMWFSQGLFGLAAAQVPMVNMWDDHDIIDGYGSYPHHFMSTPVFTGIGAVAFKYYMLFQHQSIADETQAAEPSWLLGAAPGPYINQLSRSLYVSLGRGIDMLALDCRTERMRDEVLSQESYDAVFDRCRREIQGQTRHLIVLLGIPIAYPRLNFLENVLTSRIMDPVKALGRAGMLGNFLNRFDGGVELLDDLEDHWTAKHHKHEREWLIQELQELAAEKSVRITILGGDVHLAAVGQFYSNPKLGIPKDRDHRYMPNVISSAIVNTPPPELMSDVINKRNKVHHLDEDTDEDMIPLFQHDVDGSKRNNNHLLPRRNWCAIREYEMPAGSAAPAQRSEPDPAPRRRSFSLSRSLSRNRDGEKTGFFRRLSTRQNPPSAWREPAQQDNTSSSDTMVESDADDRGRPAIQRSDSYHRKPNLLTRKASKRDSTGRGGNIDLQGGLDITISAEINPKDPAGFTEPYRLIVPALHYEGPGDVNGPLIKGGLSGFMGSIRKGRNSRNQSQTRGQDQPIPGSNAYGAPVGVASTNDASNTRGFDGGTATASAPAPIVPLAKEAAATSFANSSLDPESPQEHATTNAPPAARAPPPRVSSDAARPSGTSFDSDPNQPSQSAMNRLPRAHAPNDTDHFYDPPPPRRFGQVSGPPPPANLEQLPASVQRRYLELSEGSGSQRPQRSASLSASNSQSRRSSQPQYSQLNDPVGQKRYGQVEPLEQAQAASQPPRPAPVTQPVDDGFRRYSKGPMESPLLPVGLNQLRSSHHRTLQSVEDPSLHPGAPPGGPSMAYVNSLPIVGGNAFGADSRPTTGDATYSEPYDEPSHGDFDDFDSSVDTQSFELGRTRRQAANNDKLARHFGANTHARASSGGSGAPGPEVPTGRPSERLDPAPAGDRKEGKLSSLVRRLSESAAPSGGNRLTKADRQRQSSAQEPPGAGWKFWKS